jgi:hypothetical protein
MRHRRDPNYGSSGDSFRPDGGLRERPHHGAVEGMTHPHESQGSGGGPGHRYMRWAVWWLLDPPRVRRKGAKHESPT